MKGSSEENYYCEDTDRDEEVGGMWWGNSSRVQVLIMALLTLIICVRMR